MNYLDIIRRAFRITWTHKWLWLLGFAASLSGGGAGGFFGTGADNTGGNGFITTTSRGSPFLGLLSLLTIYSPADSPQWPVYIGMGLFVIAVLWLGTLLLGEIGHGGLIANVDDIERGGSPTFGDGWRAGVTHMRRMADSRQP
jgi:hypothetical protein